MLKDKGILKALWVGMYILCTVLGFVTTQDRGAQVLMKVFALLFFAPPFADLWFSWKRKDRGELRLLRNISIISLASTTVLLVLNLLSALSRSAVLGQVLHYALVLVSTPYLCGQYSAYSLLLWATLLWCCINLLWKHKK